MFLCPVCKAKLDKYDGVYSCENNHSFDISKYGYVNLLVSNQSSLKRHGDDKLMVQSRRRFLSGGFYEKLRNDICRVIKDNVKDGSTIADIGCGEGYYTSAICESGEYDVCGIDISKDALRYCAKAIPTSEFAVASAFSLPLADKYVDCIVNIFAPSAYTEFNRVLKDDGVLVKAVPLDEHLWELKCALYDEPYKNKPEKRDDELFCLFDSTELKYTIRLDNKDDIADLFRMTPYYYKTGRVEAQRLSELQELETTVHFCVEIYKKR